MSLEKLLAALKANGVSHTSGGEGLRFACPHHGGKGLNVVASVGDKGQVLLRCHSGGCDVKDIAAGLGLSMADLAPTSARPQKLDRQKTVHPSKQKAIQAVLYGLSKRGELIGQPTVYDYHDASGVCVFAVVRQQTSDGKTFAQVSAAEGGWVCKGPPPRNLPLWKLPEVLAADPGTLIVVCEGEKAAGALIDRGILATTSAGGASKAACSDWSVLRGRGVLILPDADPPGKKYSVDVARLCTAAGAAVVVADLRDDWPELPDKGDAYDWLQFRSNDTSKQLRERLESLRDRLDAVIHPKVESSPFGDHVRDEKESASEGDGSDFRDAWKASFNPRPLRPVLIEGLLRRGEVGNIVAATKAGKSWLGLGLLYAVSTGGDWLGRRTLPGHVLLVDNELHPETLENRLFEVGRGLNLAPDHARHRFDYLNLRGNWQDFESVCERIRQRYVRDELALIVFDAKYRFFVDPLEENSNEDQTQFHNSADGFAVDMNVAVLFVHHATKGTQSEKALVDIGAGGGAQARAVDLHCVIRPHEIDGHSVLEAAVRSFPAVEPQTIRFDWPVWTPVSGVSPVVAKTTSAGLDRKRLSGALRASLSKSGSEWQSLSALAAKLGTKADRSGFRSAIAELVSSGFAELTDDFLPPRRKVACEAVRLKDDGFATSDS